MSGPPDEPSDPGLADDPEPPDPDEPTLLDQGDRTAQEPTVAHEPHHLVDEVAISRFAGFMSMPVSRRFPLRRSTVLMAAAFVGFGVLLYYFPPQTTPSFGRHTAANGQQYDVVPVPSTTTTTVTPPYKVTPVTSSTVPTTNPVASSSTTSTAPSHTTTIPVHPSTTTTTRPGSTTTSSTTTSSTSTTTTAPGVSQSTTPTTAVP
jgi:hypothetical protein